MEETTKRRSSLGRGLNALFGEAADDYEALDKVRQSKQVPIEFVHPGRFQPRRKFDHDAIQSLVDSVKERGILQPLLVRRHPDDRNAYEIIAGERRWRAAQLAGLHEVPVIIRDLTDRDALELALVENIQRQDLTPLEEAEGYRRLMDEFGHTQENLAKALGKSRSHIANTLRLLSLPVQIRQQLHDGALTAGHARALLGVPDAEKLAQQVVEKGMSVRQVEQLARDAQAHARGDDTSVAAVTAGLKKAGVGAKPVKDADTLALEQEITNRLGLRVTINAQGQSGSLTVQYQNLDQLDEVLHRLSQGGPATEM
jgi:ParB family chromosome partitioning protein